jgi:imidazole glycerol-phosphate synthase subunit HisH
VIAIVDAGLGNLRSVAKAFEATGTLQPVRVTSEAAVVRDAARVVVPGQGAFGDCASALGPDAPLGGAIADHIRAGKPYLGICLGLQVLFQESEESPGHPGLGIFRGRVSKLPSGTCDEDGRRLKVPHIGWARVAVRATHPVLDVPSADNWFYFVHSYHAQPVDQSLIAAVAAFGSMPLTAAIARENVVAVQYHPEKSQGAGLELLRQFVEWKC